MFEIMFVMLKNTELIIEFILSGGNEYIMGIIDLSFLIESNMPTCGTKWHQETKLAPMGTLDEVGRNTHSILLGSHSGTHMDAPYHFIADGRTIDETDLSITCGEVTIVDLRKLDHLVVNIDDMKKVLVTERMLFVFGWYKKWKTADYYKEFPCFSQDAVEYLIDNGMKLMAMDTPSPDTGAAILEKDDSPNHKRLLKENVTIVEYLANTDAIDMKKKYEIIALPLKLKGCDGSPCRVILKERI